MRSNHFTWFALLLGVSCVELGCSGGGGASGGGGSCSTCESTTCSAPVATCDGVADCKATIDCFSACNQSDLNCVGNCPQPTTTDGQNDLDPVLNCWCSSCASQCGLMQGYGVCK